MKQACWTTQLKHLASGGVLGLAILVVSQTAVQAQDQDEGNFITRFERKVWGGVVRGLGLRSDDDPVIEYRERSPLVVPPSRDLPPPQAGATTNNPAWPVDPDVSRQRARSDAKRKLSVDASRNLDRQGNPALFEDVNARGGTTTGSTGSSNAPRSGPEGGPVAPSELGYFGGIFSGRAWGFGSRGDEIGTFTSEPPRTTLTAPPAGYQTPSAEHPYGTTRRIERGKVEAHDPAGRVQ